MHSLVTFLKGKILYPQIIVIFIKKKEKKNSLKIYKNIRFMYLHDLFSRCMLKVFKYIITNNI